MAQNGENSRFSPFDANFIEFSGYFDDF